MLCPSKSHATARFEGDLIPVVGFPLIGGLEPFFDLVVKEGFPFTTTKARGSKSQTIQNTN